MRDQCLLGRHEDVSVLIGIGVASWLGEAIAILPIIAMQGAGYVVAGFVVLLALRHTAVVAVHIEDADKSAEAIPAERPRDVTSGVPGGQ